MSVHLASLEHPGLLQEAIDLAWRQFAPVVNGDREAFDREIAGTDPALSCGLLSAEGQLVGAYLLGIADLRAILDGENIIAAGCIHLPERPVTCIEGNALVVDPRCRGRGLGRRLRDWPHRLGADLVIGEQAKSLANLEQWLAHRVLVAETRDSWWTAAAYASDIILDALPRMVHFTEDGETALPAGARHR